MQVFVFNTVGVFDVVLLQKLLMFIMKKTLNAGEPVEGNEVYP